MRIRQSTDAAQAADFYAKASRQIPYATSLALNRVAQAIADALVDLERQVFDRPTPYTLNALRVVRATKTNLQARVEYRDAGAKGISASQFLWAQVFGGSRSLKRSEKALAKTGLPAGSFLVPAAAAEMDAYGNVSRGQIVRLMSYLQAFGEQGYRANATVRSRAATAKLGRTEDGYRRINGVMYFVSRGKGTIAHGRRQPLPAGIWRKTGTHGADVAPVLLAVQAPSYHERLPFYETADRIYGERFGAEYATALDTALATAK